MVEARRFVVEGRRRARIAYAAIVRGKPRPRPAAARRRRRARQAAIASTPRTLERDGPLLTAVPYVRGVSRLELRRQAVFANVDRDAAILEIGPAHNAILPKREGYRTKTVDYLDREGLIEKYSSMPQYSPDDIEDVDYVLPPGAPMATVIPDRFDLVLASHVLEHTTSLVGFLRECSALLTESGVLALVVPDSRFCFDRFRQRSSLGAVIDAEDLEAPVHSRGTIVDFTMNAVKRGGSTAWSPGNKGSFSLVNGPEQAREALASFDPTTYVDVHHWVFTPHHLRLLLHDLATLGLTELSECYFHDTVGHEFFINLSRSGEGPGLDREQLLALADDEVRTWEPRGFAEEPAVR